MAELNKNITDVERAKALGMSLKELIAYRTGVVNAMISGNVVVVETKKPVIVEVVKSTGEVVKVNKT